MQRRPAEAVGHPDISAPLHQSGQGLRGSQKRRGMQERVSHRTDLTVWDGIRQEQFDQGFGVGR